MRQTKLSETFYPVREYIEDHDTRIVEEKEPIKDQIKRHKSQEERILDVLQDYDKIPTSMLISMNIYNHTARISGLRKKGHHIESIFEDNKYFYRLEE